MKEKQENLKLMKEKKSVHFDDDPKAKPQSQKKKDKVISSSSSSGSDSSDDLKRDDLTVRKVKTAPAEVSPPKAFKSPLAALVALKKAKQEEMGASMPRVTAGAKKGGIGGNNFMKKLSQGFGMAIAHRKISSRVAN